MLVDAPGLYSYVGIKKYWTPTRDDGSEPEAGQASIPSIPPDPPRIKPGLPVLNGALFTKDPTYMPLSWQMELQKRAGFL